MLRTNNHLEPLLRGIFRYTCTFNDFAAFSVLSTLDGLRGTRFKFVERGSFRRSLIYLHQ
jgi:hypothetical protein